MKFQLSLVFIIALLGVVSANVLDNLLDRLAGPRDALPKLIEPIAFPRDPLGIADALGLGSGGSASLGMGGMSSSGSLSDVLNSLSEHFSNTANRFYALIEAIVDDVATSRSRFSNSRLNQQLQRNIEKFFGRLNKLLKLLQNGLSGNISFIDFIKEKIGELSKLIPDTIMGGINLINAGIPAGHLMPKTYEKFLELMQELFNDLRKFVISPRELLRFFRKLTLGNLNGGMSMTDGLNSMRDDSTNSVGGSANSVGGSAPIRGGLTSFFDSLTNGLGSSALNQFG